MIETVPERRLDAARPGRQVRLLLRRRGRRPGLIGELVDDDVAVARVLRQDHLVDGARRCRQQRRLRRADGRLGVGQDEVVLAERADELDAGLADGRRDGHAGSDRLDGKAPAGHVGRRTASRRASAGAESERPTRGPAVRRRVIRAASRTRARPSGGSGGGRRSGRPSDRRSRPAGSRHRRCLRCGRDRRRRANRRPRSGPSASVSSSADAMWRRGTSRMCVGARGAMSRNAMTRSSSWRRSAGIDPGGDAAEQAADGRPRHVVVRRHHSTGFELIRNPIVPTSPAIRYDT